MQKVHGKILIVDDDKDVLTAARVVLRQQFTNVEAEHSPERLFSLLQQNKYDVILLDMNFSAGRMTGNEGLFWLKQILKINPQQRVVLITAYGDIQLAVEAMKEGAADFIVKPWENEKLEATVHAAFETSQAISEDAGEKKKQNNQNNTVNEAVEIIGESAAFKSLLKIVEKAATSDANVLLLGENGTGKDLIAKFLQVQSNRKINPFVKVDVGSLPENLFESELFGYRKGAFTDARQDKPGRIESANRGTLFLDEIGNISLAQQAKLLSVLQNRKVTPLGSNTSIDIDVRLISATNQDIRAAVRQGDFRQDLLYRINTVEIILPALRDRKEDIALLANHFLAVYTSKYRKANKSLPEETLRYLEKYSWPGNVRELQHAVERAVIMSEQNEITKKDFQLNVSNRTGNRSEILSLDAMERNAILVALQKHRGNMSSVAKELGVGRTTLYRKMTKYGIANDNAF